MALAFLWKLSICKSYNTKVLHPLLLREEPQYSLPLNCKTGVSLPPRVLKNGDPWRPPHSLRFLCSHKGLIHHIPLTLSLSSQRPSHILPFLCNHKASYIWLSLPSQKPHTSHTSYLFFALTKASKNHIHLTLSLQSQRLYTPHPPYLLFAITKTSYITPFVCLHKDLIHHIHLTLSLPSQRPPTSWWRGWWSNVAVWGCRMPRCPHTSHPGCQQGEPSLAKRTAWKGTATEGTAGKRMQGTAINHAHLLTQVCKTQLQRGNNYNTRITQVCKTQLQRGNNYNTRITQVCKTQLQRGNNYNTRITQACKTQLQRGNNYNTRITQVCKTQLQRGNNYNTRITLSSMAALQWHPGERSWQFYPWSGLSSLILKILAESTLLALRQRVLEMLHLGFQVQHSQSLQSSLNQVPYPRPPEAYHPSMPRILFKHSQRFTNHHY